MRERGLIGRNGTGKTTLLRHMAMHAIDGIPNNCQILHVEQKVVGDDTSVLQCILNTDMARTQLLEEEGRLLELQRVMDLEGEAGKGDKLNGRIDKTSLVRRIEEIYKRLDFIDTYSAESRATTISVPSNSVSMLWLASVLITVQNVCSLYALCLVKAEFALSGYGSKYES